MRAHLSACALVPSVVPHQAQRDSFVRIIVYYSNLTVLLRVPVNAHVPGIAPSGTWLTTDISLRSQTVLRFDCLGGVFVVLRHSCTVAFP